ncbi:MAG: DNA polymerase IV, partial [Nitriliruptoraceae bacterium]
AFFASIEQRDHPRLRGVPVAVGGVAGRGVVAAASYEARSFGVHSAMPMATARARCPALIVVPPRGSVYRDVSQTVMHILCEISARVEPVSLDEAYVDVAGAQREFGDPVTIAHLIRQRVRSAVDLPCSVGVAATKSVAKLLSARAKPDGVLHWPDEEVAARLRPLPVRAVAGVGPRTADRLDTAGITTIGALADTDVMVLARILGGAAAHRLHELAHGRDAGTVEPSTPARSISNESTFSTDIADAAVIRARGHALADDVGRRLRAAGLAARTVQLKLRTADFTTCTRAMTEVTPFVDTAAIATAFDALLPRAWDGVTPVRLVGIGVQNLAPVGPQQLGFDDAAADVRRPARARIDEVTDELRSRLGATVIQRASTLALREDGIPTRALQAKGRKVTDEVGERRSR